MKKFDFKRLETELDVLRSRYELDYAIRDVCIHLLPTNAECCLWTPVIDAIFHICEKYNLSYYIDFDRKLFVIC